MDRIGYHQESIVNKQDHSNSKSDIHSPLQVWIDIISQSIKRIGYLILTLISSLGRRYTVQSSLLDFIILICIFYNGIQNSNRIAPIFSPSSRLLRKTRDETNHQERYIYDKKKLFHTEGWKLKAPITAERNIQPGLPAGRQRHNIRPQVKYTATRLLLYSILFFFQILFFPQNNLQRSNS